METYKKRLGELVLVLGVVAMSGLCGKAQADDWTYFRGARFDGVSTEKGWEARFGKKGLNEAWRVNVGVGASSVTVKGDKVLTMGNQNDRDTVVCLSATNGRILWKHGYDAKFEKRMFDGGTAATPTIDGDRVYALSYDGQLRCLNLNNGALIWEKHLLDDFGGKLSEWKYACSPLVEGDLLILDNGGKGNSTLALNKKTGEKVWGSGDRQAGYASAIPYNLNGVRSVIVMKGKDAVSLEVGTGREQWSMPWKTSWDVNASSPTVIGSRVLISSGYPGNSGRGGLYDLSSGKPVEIWLNKDIKTKITSCAVYEGHVYAVSQEKGGTLLCVNLESGETVWSERGFGVYGNAMIAGGQLIVLSEKGELSIGAATAKGWAPIGKAKVLEDKCWVAPVLANGRLYCRNNQGVLVCLDMRVSQN